MKKISYTLILILGLVLDVMGIYYYSMLYDRTPNNTMDANIVQQYQRDHIFAQVYTMYGIGLTMIGSLALILR